MKKEKLIYAIPVFILLLFGAVQLADAALTVTWLSPTTGTSIAGTAFFNVTAQPDPYNCTVKIYSAKTANTTQYTVFTMYNTTYGKATNATYLTSRFEDANDYTIVATCTNQTGGATGQGTATLTGMTIDNTVPTAPASGTIAADTRIKEKDNSTLVFTMTVVDSTMTGNCIFYIGPNSGGPYNSYTATASGTTCTYTWTVEEGSYEYYMSATDGTNTTNSAKVRNIDVVGGVSPGGVAAVIIASGGEIQTAGGVSGGQKATGGMSIATILILAAAGVVLWKFVLPKKKK